MRKVFWICFLLLGFVLSSCVKIHKKNVSSVPLSFIPRFVQFGNMFFFSKAPKISFKFKDAKEIIKTKDGFFVKPIKNCIYLKWKKNNLQIGEKKICLTDVPPVIPHIKIENINSAYVKVRIISLFPKISLFFWEKNGNSTFSNFNFNNQKIVKPGDLKISSFSIGKSYFISGAIKFKNYLYGPLTPPILVKINDNTPPLPPSGGGYIIKGNTIYLVWDKSPSDDVKGYQIKRDNKIFFSRKTEFEEKCTNSIIIYEIRAVDKAGNTSKPLIIKVQISSKGGSI